MARNKSRLYLAVYSRPRQPYSYQYALQLSPKDPASSTQKYSTKTVLVAKNGTLSVPWVYETVPVFPNNEARLVARIRLGKVMVERRKIDDVMEGIGLGGKGFDSCEWVRRALDAIVLHGYLDLNSQQSLKDLGWDSLKEVVLPFVDRKLRETWSQQQSGWEREHRRVASLDLMSGEEFMLP